MAPADERPVPHRSDALGDTRTLHRLCLCGDAAARHTRRQSPPLVQSGSLHARLCRFDGRMLSARLLPYLHHAVAHEHRHGYRSGRKRRIHRVLPLHRTLRTLPRGLEPRRRHQPPAGKGFAGPAHRTDAPCRPAHLPADDHTGGGGNFRTDIQRLRLRIGLAALPHTRPA